MFGKQKRLDPALHIHLDWKCNGNDVFGMFPGLYPSLKCLQGTEYETLADELAFEGGEESMGALAAFLEPHKLELWNINDHGDNYRLAIVQTKHVDAFVEFWKSDEASLDDSGDESEADTEADTDTEDEHEDGDQEAYDFSFDLERIAPVVHPGVGQAPHDQTEAESAAIATSAAAEPSTKKKPKGKAKPVRIDVVEDQFFHLSYGGISFRPGVDRYWVENRETGAHDLVDFSSWPPSQLVAGVETTTRDDAGWKTRPRLVGEVGGIDVWQVDGTPKRKNAKWVDRFVTAPSYDPLELQPWGDQSKRYANIYNGAEAIAGESVFVHTSSEDQSGTVHRVTASSEDELYSHAQYEGNHAVFALDADTCLLIVDEKKFRILGSGAPKKWTKHPGKLYGEIHLFDQQTLIYFSETTAKGFGGHFDERRLTLNLYNFATSNHRSVLLEDFVTKGRFNLNMRRDQPNNYIPFNSVDGNVEIARGHGDWWILGCRTNMSGKTDRAWMWHSVTNEWLRITPQDFPREQPAIRYLASLGRYVADDSCQLDLLIDFDQLYSSRETFTLEWS
jgi:hypothetical protein